MARYYDVVLGLIPLTFATIAALMTGLGFTITTAAPAGLVVCVGLIGHAMFVNGPVDETPTTSANDASAGHQTAD